MVYKCCIVGCSSNYTTEEANTVFFLFQRTRILGKDGLNLSTEKTGYQHRRRTFVKIIFEPKYFRKSQNNKCYRLIKKLKPEPTIFNPSYVTQSSSSFNLISPVSIPRKSLKKRIFQEEQYETF